MPSNFLDNFPSKFSDDFCSESCNESFMEHAINLAKKGKWHTASNPCVGAVIVHKDTVIAEGFHSEYGKAHAEIECLLDAIHKGVFLGHKINFSNPILACANNEKNKIKNNSSEYKLSECVLYVTLEPCNHEGKTPPCTQAIIESGILHIVIGMLDPNPKASGGIATLKQAGIHIKTGILKNACKELIDDFIVWQTQKRPYVILKMATSLDGRIGPQKGDNHRISGAESHEVLMQLRENIGNSGGAILVGGNTFLKDNPRLTARTKTAEKQPYAIIVKSQLPTLTTSNETGFKCIDERPSKTLFYCSAEQSSSLTAEILREKGVSIYGLNQNSQSENNENQNMQNTVNNQNKNKDNQNIQNKQNKVNLKEMLEHVYKEKACPYVLCEGGSRLGLSLLEDGLVDELILYMAPIVMGDETSKPVFTGHIMSTMADALRFNIKETKLLGSDLHIYLKPERICLQD